MADDITVRIVNDGYWEWFERPSPLYDIQGLHGKYLFFSANREALRQIAIDELMTGGFSLAKTQMEGAKPRGDEFVLCLYHTDDSRKQALAIKYRGRANVKYRYWKLNRSERPS